MKIEPTPFFESHRQHYLPESLTEAQVQKALPGITKTDVGWLFLADGHKCAIWQRGRSWSGYGPESVFVALGFHPVNPLDFM